jgi:hypothetical protein
VWPEQLLAHNLQPRLSGNPAGVAGLMEKIGGVTRFLFPVTPPTGGLELVGVVLPATTQVESASEVHRFASLNVKTVLAK